MAGRGHQAQSANMNEGFHDDGSFDSALHGVNSFPDELSFRLDIQTSDKEDDDDTTQPSLDMSPHKPNFLNFPEPSLKDLKRQRIQNHPKVVSVSSNGREIECKCGRIVRLNPPWYILKYEQHLASRNCGNTKKPPRKKSPKQPICRVVPASTSSSVVDSILAQGEPGPDASVLAEHRFRMAQELRQHPKFVSISNDGMSIECSCHRIIPLQHPWHINSFVEHASSEICARQIQRKRRLPNPLPRQPPSIVTPCPGLRGADVQEYIQSSIQLTGGSRPRHIIARELFPQLFPASGPCEISKVLCPTEKRLLYDTMQKEALWWIDKDGNTIRSLQCTGLASRLTDSSRLPCSRCSHLRTIPSFRTAITSASKPDKSNRQTKFIPRSMMHGTTSAIDAMFTQEDYEENNKKRHHTSYMRELKELLEVHSEEGNNPHHFWLGAAEMGIAKEFDEYPVLIAVLHCLATLKEKERRGVGKQNMPYSPALDSFLHSLNEVSEDACALFQHHFCGRTKKNKQKSLVPSKSLMALLAVSSTDPTSQLGDILLPLTQEEHATALHLDTEVISTSIRKENGAQEIEAREAAWQSHASQHPNQEIPCPGLTAMPEYVEACFQLVGGSRPRHVLAKDYLPQALSDGKLILSSLTPSEQDLLNDAVFHESLWRIDKPGKCVRSRQCSGSCTRKTEACTNCLLLLRNASFRSAVSRAKRRAQDPSARLESLRFVPRQFTKRDPLLRKVAANSSLRTLVVEAKSIADEANVFWLQLARLGLNGAFRSFPVVEGVVQSVIDLKDKARRGVGKQNMSYTPALDTFLQQLSDISLPAFELFAKHFCVRSLRSSKLVKKRKLEQIENPTEPMAMPAMLMYTDDPQERLLALNDMGGVNANLESNVVLTL